MELPFMASEAIIVEMVKHGANRQVQCVVYKCSYTETAILCVLPSIVWTCLRKDTYVHTLIKKDTGRLCVVHIS